MSEIKIEIAREEDAAELLNIYKPYVEETAITFEYDVPTVEEFAGRIRRIKKRYPYIVAKVADEIVGYAYAGAFKERAAYDWAVETSIYVKKGVTKSGIGKKLYQELEKALGLQGIINVNACIACPKIVDEHLDNNSVEFHKHMGYRLVGEFEACGYKFGRWYNMVWMERMLGEHPDKPVAVRLFPEVEEVYRKSL